MKITVYELIGMVFEHKAPKKILFEGETYTFNEDNNLAYCYTNDNNIFDDNLFRNVDELNEEVEILETTITYKSDKIEKIDLDGYTLSPTGEGIIEFTISEKILANKINELIDRWNNER